MCGPLLQCEAPARTATTSIHDAPGYRRGRRRFPLNDRKFQIGMATIVLLVALRLSLGCHFLYEGVWKIKHSGEFSAEPFLTGAKGPMSGLFYAMVDDINGRQRLRVEEIEKIDKEGKKTKLKTVNSDALAKRWDDLRQQFVDYCKPGPLSDEDAQKRHEELEKAAQLKCDEHRKSAVKYLADNVDEIEVYFAALDRYEQDPERSQGAPFQKERRWNKMQELRKDANGWIAELQAREETYKDALRGLLDDDSSLKAWTPGSWNPLRWTRLQQINFAVTYGLTAIGLCLMLGFFTRLAALGGAGFMAFVVMTTWAWPGTYPPDPPVVGHALLISKDFIEMIALLLLASTVAGRWGGLDYFTHTLLIEPFFSKRIRQNKK
jgi:uncharacterized membrane protein YphA (DoxX/SURF4 family)